MVTSIIATFFALIFLTTIAININKMAKYKIQYNSVGNVLAGTQVMIGLIEIVVAITTSTFSCRAVCCRKRHEPGMVFYNANVPNIPNEELFVNSPPDYEEIAGAQALLENDDEMVQKKPI